MSDENPYAAPESNITPTETGQLAGRGIRLGGAIIDGLLALVVIWPAMLFFGYWDRAMAGQQGAMDGVLIGGLGMVVFVLLHGYFLANSGQTIGKRILGIQIVSVEDDSILPLWNICQSGC